MPIAAAATDWSRLPGDMLESIANRLSNNSEAGDHLVSLRLRAVCRSWRASLVKSPPTSFPPLPLRLPFPMVPNPYLTPIRRDRGYFSLSRTTLYYIQPLSSPSTFDGSSGWLLRLEQINSCNNRYRPLNPLTTFSTERFPLIASFPHSLNLLDVRTTEIGTAYTLDYVDRREKKIVSDVKNYHDAQSTYVKAAAVSPSDPSLTVAIVGGRLGFYRLGDQKWTVVDFSRDLYHDVICGRNGNFYAVDNRGRTVAIAISGKGKKANASKADVEVIVVSRLPAISASQYMRLVEGSGSDDLFLVEKFMDRPGHKIVTAARALTCGLVMEDQEMPVYFNVYRLNKSEKIWERVVGDGGLGDQVFVLGRDCSFLVSARDFPALKGGCIYFSDTRLKGIYFSDTTFFERNAEPRLAKSCIITWVHSLKDGHCGPLTGFPDHWTAFSPPPAWLQTPPPV